MNAILMRDDHFYHGPVDDVDLLRENIGESIGEITLPKSCLIAMIERDGEVIIATPDVILQSNDEVAIIGEPEDIEAFL